MQGSPASRPDLAIIRAARMMRGLEWLMVPIVVALGFMLASFSVRNSDFWMHLATGRLIAEGNYAFGKDPFSFVSEGRTWVNHAWLTDLVWWKLYNLTPEHEAVVAVKAGSIAALALILLLACRPVAGDAIPLGSRPDPSRWVAAICVGLALVAMGPRLILQPAVVSFLFAGITLYVLHHSERWSGRALPVMLAVLFAIWVNMDQWFLIGPSLVALYLVGELGQRLIKVGAPPADPGRIRSLAAALGVGLVACLLNPHHVAAFTRLPIELVSNLDPEMKNDPAYRLQFLSPLDVIFFNRTDLGKSFPGGCYLALLTALTFSFTLNLRRIRLAHFLVALAMMGLSFWNWRLIPFFAIVAAPIAVWNIHSLFAARPPRWTEASEDSPKATASDGESPGTQEGWWPGATEPNTAAEVKSATLPVSADARPEWTVTPETIVAFLAVMGRLATVLLGLVALAAAYPGWLHAKPSVPTLQRRFSWEVAAEPGLKQAAERLQELTKSGDLPVGTRGLSLSLDFANYVAFFAPDVRSFMDLRYTLLGHVSRDFMKVRRGLNDLVANVETPEDYSSVLRKYDISYLVLDIEYTSGGGERLFARLLMEPQEWTLWYQNGKVAFFGWHDPSLPPQEDPLRLDLVALAFGAKAQRLPPSSSSEVKREAPPEVRTELTWLDRYFQAPPPPAPPETLAASLYWQLREPAQQRALQMTQAVLAHAIAAGWVAQFAAANYYTPFATNFPPAVVEEVARQMAAADPLPAAAAVLAVREARRGVLARPNDGLPYLMLGMAYETMPAVSVELRKLQQVSTLHQALDRMPPEQADGPAGVMVATALQRLYNLHREHGELDLAEEALSHAVRIFDKHPPLGVTEANRDRVKEYLVRSLDSLRNDLVAARDRFQNDLDSLRKRNVPLQVQVALAVNYGLIREAIALIEDPAQKLDLPVLQQAVQIYLALGRVDDALRIIEQVPESLKPNFRELQFNAWVAAGEYALAGQRLMEIIASLERADDPTRRAVLAASAIQQLHFATVDPMAASAMFATVPWGLRIYLNIAASLQTDRVTRAGLLATRGILAVEEGDLETARTAFRDALAVGIPFPGIEQARIYLKILERAIEPKS